MASISAALQRIKQDPQAVGAARPPGKVVILMLKPAWRPHDRFIATFFP